MPNNYTIQVRTTKEIKEKIRGLASNRGQTLTKFIIDKCLKSDFEERIENDLKEIQEILKKIGKGK